MRLLDSNYQEVTNLDLGIVKAGEFKEYTYYLFNDSQAKVIDIDVKILHHEIDITTFPKQLIPNEKKELMFSWKPSLTVKKGLKALVSITGTELWE